MQARVYAECDIPETELEVAYREANCELISERDREDLKAEALATCLEFMDREREFECG